MSDAAETKRLIQTHGFGDVIFDDETGSEEMSEMLLDLGVENRYGANTPD